MLASDAGSPLMATARRSWIPTSSPHPTPHMRHGAFDQTIPRRVSCAAAVASDTTAGAPPTPAAAADATPIPFRNVLRSTDFIGKPVVGASRLHPRVSLAAREAVGSRLQIGRASCRER